MIDLSKHENRSNYCNNKMTIITMSYSCCSSIPKCRKWKWVRFFCFVASPRWLTNFIKDYKISYRRVIRFLFKKEIKSLEILWNLRYNFKFWCSQFQLSITLTLLLIRIKMVTNIELMFQERTSEKKVELYIDDLNKITYYTA